MKYLKDEFILQCLKKKKDEESGNQLMKKTMQEKF